MPRSYKDAFSKVRDAARYFSGKPLEDIAATDTLASLGISDKSFMFVNDISSEFKIVLPAAIRARFFKQDCSLDIIARMLIVLESRRNATVEDIMKRIRLQLIADATAKGPVEQKARWRFATASALGSDPTRRMRSQSHGGQMGMAPG